MVQSIRENLWFACHRCNEFKGNRTQARDPVTEELVQFFNPRTQHWFEHFTWSPDGTHIIGITACGRATVIGLQLNNTHIVAARRFWVQTGFFPPSE